MTTEWVCRSPRDDREGDFARWSESPVRQAASWLRAQPGRQSLFLFRPKKASWPAKRPPLSQRTRSPIRATAFDPNQNEAQLIFHCGQLAQLSVRPPTQTARMWLRTENNCGGNNRGDHDQHNCQHDTEAVSPTTNVRSGILTYHRGHPSQKRSARPTHPLGRTQNPTGPIGRARASYHRRGAGEWSLWSLASHRALQPRGFWPWPV
jgi:hypothetical protein